MADGVYDIYAIRYGHHDRKAAENYIGGDPHDVLQPLDYFVWAIVGAHGTFIVDTGFDEAMAQKRKRLVTNPIGEGLKAIGIDPETVENVIVTHLHYDHAGNYELFPRARYHLQDVDFRGALVLSGGGDGCGDEPHDRLAGAGNHDADAVDHADARAIAALLRKGTYFYRRHELGNVRR